jgi:predicted dithiol-disulfide oxidoreductase (DUF899 family)
MTSHKTGSRDEWLAARLDLLVAEKELTRRSDEVARQRQELPWVRIDKDYVFDTDEGTASLADLFRGRSQLLIYHFMFGPDYEGGCPSCSAIADGFNGSVVHLANHDVTLYAVSRAPLAKLQAYKERMGWSFPWASASDSDFNYDFHVTHDEDVAPLEYNYRSQADHEAAGTGYYLAGDQPIESPGLSAFLRDGDDVFHTYSNFARGGEMTGGSYYFLDLTALGRQEEWEEPKGRAAEPRDATPDFAA